MIDTFLLVLLGVSFASAVVRVVAEHWPVFVVIALTTTLVSVRVATMKRLRDECRQRGHVWEPTSELAIYPLECQRCGKQCY